MTGGGVRSLVRKRCLRDLGRDWWEMGDLTLMFAVMLQLIVSHRPGEDLGKLVKRYEDDKGKDDCVV